jgi:Rrf2 family protein
MLVLSSKVRYATRILVFLTSMPAGQSVSAKKISEAEGISFEYVEQILIHLKAAKFVKSTRGPLGGFVLSAKPENITVADIISTLEGGISIIPCASESCPRDVNCRVKHLWHRANDALKEIFSSTTLQDLTDKMNDQGNEILNFEI